MIDVMLFCLIANVYFEARGEPLAGQHAVAEVTLRRAAISGRNICNEVFEDRQFSWTLAERPVVRDAEAWKKAQAVALKALLAPTNFSRGATNFHVVGKPPRSKWHLKLCKTATIGNHVFYKECDK
jgi:spore germination cell wall hydrolase CwlJ-like protein